MDKPHIPDAPGLSWRPRSNGWAAVWVARQDIVKRGFGPSTRQLAVFTAPPTPAEIERIEIACTRLQLEMYRFIGGEPQRFAGTVRALISAYQTDPDSPYHGSRYRTRVDFDNIVKRIDAAHGQE